VGSGSKNIGLQPNVKPEEFVSKCKQILSEYPDCHIEKEKYEMFLVEYAKRNKLSGSVCVKLG
jgi:hypothetical protein